MFFQKSKNSMFRTWPNSKISFFSHNIVKWLRKVKNRRSKFALFWLKMFQFLTNFKWVVILRARTVQPMMQRRIFWMKLLVRVKRTQISTRTVDSSQVFKWRILYKQLNNLKKPQKIGTIKTLRGLKQVCPEQTPFFLPWLLALKQFSSNFYYLLISGLPSTLTFSLKVRNKWSTTKDICT